MIFIEEIVEKLQNILNGTDESVAGLTRYNDFYFDVQSAGFHIDHIINNNAGSNYIPVFVDVMGGEYDPIPELKKGTFTIPVTIYFPVRFKNAFYNINEFLVEALVGKVLNWGTNTGNCLSTISVATYGEIVGLDLKQFATWVENTYQKQIDVMEPFRSMEFTLYLQSGTGLIYGNQVEFEMAYTYNSTRYPDATGYYKLKCADRTSGVNNEPISQQLINTDSYTKSIANITNRSKSLLVYVENNDFWSNIIDAYNNGTINDILDTIEVKKVYKLGSASENKTFTMNGELLVLSITENNELGSPLSFTFTFADKYTTN